jgi:pilus assembly protein Flp/PilA
MKYNLGRATRASWRYRFDTGELRTRCCSGEDANSQFEFQEIQMLSIFRKLMKNDDGATAIEYVLIASLISVAAIAAMTSVGGKVSNVLSNVANAMR